MFKKFYGKKARLKMKELKVFFLSIFSIDNVNGINFDGLRQYINREDDGANLEIFYMNNYNLLKDKLTFIYKVNYSNLMAAVNEIPTDYFKKFNNLNYVRSINEIINQERFLEFLKNVKKLKSLHLQYPNLNQSIYDRLSASCSLTAFALMERESIPLNFDFIAKFNELKRLDLNQNVSLEVVKSLVGHKSMLKTLNHHLVVFLHLKELS